VDTKRLLKTIHKHTHTSPSAAPEKKTKSCAFQFSGQDLTARPSSSEYEKHRGYTLKKRHRNKKSDGLFLNPITNIDVTIQAQQGASKAALLRRYCGK